MFLMTNKIALTALLLMVQFYTFAASGLITLNSDFSVKQTTDNLVKVLEKKGMTIFAVIDHSEGAAKVDKKLRPTTVVIFGNPKIGTPLMNCAQTFAIDLPQKALIWQGVDGQVRYAYNNPEYLADRHHLVGCDKVLAKVKGALANFANAASINVITK